MAMTKDQLLAEAMSLEPHQREEIADALFASLTNAEPAEIDAAWLAESHRRDEAYRRGEVEASSVDEVIDRVHSRVK